MIRVATSNMFKRLDAAESARHVDLVLAGGPDVVLWQEVTRTHRRTLRALRARGWDTYFPVGLGGLAISWRTDRLSVHRAGRAHRAVPGIAGVDPSRGFLDIVLREARTEKLWPIIATHMTHQAWTSHPERRPRWWTLARRLERRSRRLARRYGRVVGGGDVNRHRWAPAGTVGAWPAGGTHGRSKYDVIWCRGRVALVGRVREVHTPSDHDTAVGAFRAS